MIHIEYWSVLKPKHLDSKTEVSIKVKQRANTLKYVYALENASDGILFSTVAGMKAYSFIKMWLHPRCFLMKFLKLCKT